ncbi:Chlorophyll(ide) b reductase NOL chloroplastic [Bienertia sinuspersici]
MSVSQICKSDVSSISTGLRTDISAFGGSNAYSYKPLAEASDEDLIEVVTTNTLGLMICCREAIKMMLNQPRGGHIFNIDGAGSDGRPTPRPCFSLPIFSLTFLCVWLGEDNGEGSWVASVFVCAYIFSPMN